MIELGVDRCNNQVSYGGAAGIVVGWEDTAMVWLLFR